jgi:hypothetical protein
VLDRDQEALDEIERTQAALRESIAEAKDMAAKSDRLIGKHRKQIDKG